MSTVERYVDVESGVRLWVEETGDAAKPPLLLIMGANASALGWPDALVSKLAAHHRVIRYDHRDTGRSTWAFDAHPYAVTDLARDAITVLDALGIERAHVVGMSLGGYLVQLLLLDHPDRLLSATLFGTTALGGGPDSAHEASLPGPDPRLLAFWGHLADPRDREAEIEWRIEHWRLLNGDVLPFDAEEFRRLEERAIAHAGRYDNPAAHARAAQTGLMRGAELASVRTPTLVIDAPADPVSPPPHAEHLARAIAGARRVIVPGMGHALPSVILTPLADVILQHTAVTDGAGPASTAR